MIDLLHPRVSDGRPPADRLARARRGRDRNLEARCAADQLRDEDVQAQAEDRGDTSEDDDGRGGKVNNATV